MRSPPPDIPNTDREWFEATCASWEDEQAELRAYRALDAMAPEEEREERLAELRRRDILEYGSDSDY